MNHNNNITTKEINQLEDKAFKLLPHLYLYNADGEVVGMIFYSEEDPPEWTYEEFMEELDLHCYNEDEKEVLALARKLERIEKGIDLARDVSEFSEPDWIVEGLVVRNGLTLLYGDSGTGKATLCLYLADAMQEGKDLFGLKCKGGKVLFVENDESGELLKSHRDKVGLPKNLLVAKTDVVWEAHGRFNKEFDDMLYYYPSDLLVIDAYTSLGIPDITRPESALVLDELRRRSKEHHHATLITHHTNLSGGQMGSNLHRAKMDSIVSLSRIGAERIILTQEKVRGSKFADKILDFNQDTLEMKEAGVSLKDEVRKLLSQGRNKDEIRESLPKSKKATVDRYIREVEAETRIKGASPQL